jgi:hypothetical protein
MKAQGKKHFMKSQNLQHHFASCQSLITNQTKGLGFSISPLMSVLTTQKAQRNGFKNKAHLKSKSVLTTSKVATTPKSFPSCKTIFVPKLSPPC